MKSHLPSIKSRAKLLLAQWEQNRAHASLFPTKTTLGLFAISAGQKHCSEDRLFTFHQLKSFQDSSAMNYITKEAAYGKLILSLKHFNFSLNISKYSCLYEFLFSSTFSSDLTDRWSDEDL